MLKLYPCLVLKGTKLYNWWLEGKYRPYSSEQAAGLVAELKCRVPSWMRIMRVQRDIPANLIEDGVTRSDLRELVRERMKERDLRCRCVRCREVGHRWLRDHIQTTPDRVRIIRQSYKASGGQEFFVSIEDPEQDILVGYLRLRIPSWSASRPEVVGKEACVVRELKVCGPMVPVGTKVRDAWQHRGYGRILMNEAESLAHKEGRRKILVTSALGTRQYYYRLGYSPDGPYVSKTL
jgi:elongator complex protein 3